MSDEMKTENEQTGTSTATDGNDDAITLSQEKLNSLINEKYKKGAEKATNELLSSLGVDSVDALQNALKAQQEREDAERTELEKAQNIINDLTSKVETSAQQMAKMQEESTLSALAIANGVQDIGYFKYAYNEAKSSEGFDADSFVNSLKESKPYVFNTQAATPPTDKSGNNGDSPNDLATKVQGMSLQELQALQKTL